MVVLLHPNIGGLMVVVVLLHPCCSCFAFCASCSVQNPWNLCGLPAAAQQEQLCLALKSGVSFPVALSRVRLCAFCSGVFCWSLGSFTCILSFGVCILGLGHSYLIFFFAFTCFLL